ncbi:MAG TPA: high-potential iron-sulfur protein [Novosphingobium sp.]|nr:high-potential iron-sulfur protein [Novosphingobium sp.]
MPLDRRTFVARMAMGVGALAAAGAAAPVLAAGGAAPASCADPAVLPLSQRSRRRSLGYAEPGPDPARRCSGCAFFTAGEGDCGTCQMLTGGPVSAGGTCNSFARKG